MQVDANDWLIAEVEVVTKEQNEALLKSIEERTCAGWEVEVVVLGDSKVGMFTHKPFESDNGKEELKKK